MTNEKKQEKEEGTDKDPNQKHYFTTVHANEVDAIFRNIAAQNLEVHVCLKGQTEEGMEFFEAFDYKPGLKKLLVRRTGTILQKLAPSKLTNQIVLFKIPAEKNHYFSTTKFIKDPDSKEYLITLSNEVFKSQQRTNYRLQIGPHISLQFKIDEQVFEGLDISAGGISIKIPVTEKERFAKDKIFENCVLRFNKKNYEIPKVTVAAIWEQKDRDGDVLPELRLGIKFLSIPKDVEESLVQHVNSEARGEEIRKKFKFK
jgi:hypothetical protein